MDFKDGFCSSDFQKKIMSLQKALLHKTKLCESIEDQKAELVMELSKLKWQREEFDTQYRVLELKNFQQKKRMEELQAKVDVYHGMALLKQMQEEVQRTADVLATTLEEQRAAKRARAE